MRLIALPLLALLSLPAAAEVSPYAVDQTRTIKALSTREIDDLLAGRGMGLSRPAELNGFPGPAHALELAAELGLTPTQVERLTAAKAEMTRAAQALGRRIVDNEKALEAAFVERRVDAQTVARLTGDIAALWGEVRAAHLLAHLEAAEVMLPEQIRQYVALRGYDGVVVHKHH